VAGNPNIVTRSGWRNVMIDEIFSPRVSTAAHAGAGWASDRSTMPLSGSTTRRTHWASRLDRFEASLGDASQ
jgi:hypothetical protein